jgi:hypothetical protein
MPGDDAPLPKLPDAHCGIYLRDRGDKDALEQLADALTAALQPTQMVPGQNASTPVAAATG